LYSWTSLLEKRKDITPPSYEWEVSYAYF
jgi:hypothetical protein